jgi:hypothetical protein
MPTAADLAARDSAQACGGRERAPNGPGETRERGPTTTARGAGTSCDTAGITREGAYRLRPPSCVSSYQECVVGVHTRRVSPHIAGSGPETPYLNHRRTMPGAPRSNGPKGEGNIRPRPRGFRPLVLSLATSLPALSEGRSRVARSACGRGPRCVCRSPEPCCHWAVRLWHRCRSGADAKQSRRSQAVALGSNVILRNEQTRSDIAVA